MLLTQLIGIIDQTDKEFRVKTLETMTKDEKSLLLYFESCAVDYGGKIELRRMDDIDTEIAREWKDEGFIQYGRIASESIIQTSSGVRTHWVELSEDAWNLAHEERRARHRRMFERRSWLKAEEKRELAG